MSHKQKGQLTTTSEWAKHLRKFGKRQFWKGERTEGKAVAKKELEQNKKSPK
jgi:hypothetical protein